MALRARLAARLRDRRVTSAVRRVLDDFLPPVVREWRPLNRFLATQFHGPAFDLDFKERAFAMSARELALAYAALDAGGGRYRDSDTTPAQLDAIAAAARGRVLEVGCGNGAVAERLRARHDVVAVDVTLASAIETGRRARCEVAVAGLPALPFADRAFDTVVCAHTLEHIPDLYGAAAELRRVAARAIVIVPRQRYYRYTVDYHVHFFPSAAPLIYLLGGRAELIDGDWLVVAG
ncbi:MAG TPA: class I SAM-dependent methyltransferase [Kofleriaceae bacterium]|nr:class I SAM-dependent methyltransferase [Kofleriaceae bacterium]